MTGTVRLTVILLTALCLSGPAAEEPSQARLVAAVESIQPGTPFLAGVVITLPEKWHTYWLNPGDAGMAPEMDWRLPAGFTAGPVFWPVPVRIVEPPVVCFGYDHAVLLAREIRPPAGLQAGANCTLELAISWLVCRDVCMPRTAKLRLTLPVRAETPTPAAATESLFAQAKTALPVTDSAWVFQARADAKALELTVTPPPGTAPEAMTGAIFFPAQTNLVKYGEPVWTRVQNGFCLRLERVAGGDPLPAQLQGVLVLSPERKTAPRALAVAAALAGRSDQPRE